MDEKEFSKKLNQIFRLNNKPKKMFKEHFKLIEEIKKNYNEKTCIYNIGDEVILNKDNFMRGEGAIASLTDEKLEFISKNGFISPDFTSDYNKNQKTPLTVPIWNIKSKISLKDYIINYSGSTLRVYKGNSAKGQKIEVNYTKIIPYKKLDEEIKNMKSCEFFKWDMEQTKEIRFMPSLARDNIDVAFIMNISGEYGKKILENDIYNLKFNKKILKSFIPKFMIEKFIYGKRDDFTTDRESAIIYGVPVEFIEGILVSRKFENNSKELSKIKTLFPNCYICNLDGIVIR